MTVETARRKLRLGWIGFGRLARDYYRPVLQRHAGARVDVIVDPLENSRRQAQRAFPAARVAAESDAVFQAELDALLVASPPSTHLGLWNRAAAQGLRVFLEKPFLLPGELRHARPDPDGLLAVNLNRRFWPPYRSLREQLRRGEIGSVESGLFRLHVPVLRWCTVTRHRLDAGEGGVLSDLGSQFFDLAAFLLGELPEQITARARSQRWPNDHLWVRMEGTRAPRLDFDLAYGETGAESVAVHGRRGSLVLRDPNMALHRLEPGRPRALQTRALDFATFGRRALQRDQSMMRFTIRASLEAFLRGERDRDHRVVGFDEAVRHVQLVEAVSRAIGAEADSA